MIFSRARILKVADATLGWVLCRLLGAADYFARRGQPVTSTELGDVRRMLIIRPGGMGDMIILLPVLRLLETRYPEARIDIACERRNADVLALADRPHELLLYDSHPIAFLAALLRRRYDVAIDTEQFHHFSAIFALLSRARIRVGFKINPSRNPLYTHLVNYALDGPEGEQFARLLEPLGLDPAEYRRTACDLLDPAELPRELTAAMASEFGERRHVVVHVGSSSRYKVWLHERFAEVGRRLHDEYGLGVFLVGNAADSATAERVHAALEAAGCPVITGAGSLTLRQTALLIRDARLFVGPDSGLAHIAVALGTATVILFGPSDRNKWGVRTAIHGVVHAPLPCAPCFIFGYHKPCRTIDCMHRIGVDDVMNECRRVLKGG